MGGVCCKRAARTPLLGAQDALLAEPLEMFFAKPPPGSQFAMSYEESQSRNFAFLVPGDEELFLGGGALNGAVGKLLLKDASQPIAFVMNEAGNHVMEMDPAVNREVPKYNKEECVYRKLHERMFQKARMNVRQLVTASPDDIGKAPVCFAAARVYTDNEHPFGAVFIDIFEEDKRPFSCSKNVAVVYTVGALGRNKKAEGEGLVDAAREAKVKTNAQDFVHEIFLTGENIVQAIIDFNRVFAGAASGPPRIDIVRLPIVSGGTFIHPEVTATETALALLWGAHTSLIQGERRFRPTIELMPDNAMQEAYDFYNNKQLRPDAWNSEDKKFLFAKLCK